MLQISGQLITFFCCLAVLLKAYNVIEQKSQSLSLFANLKNEEITRILVTCQNTDIRNIWFDAKVFLDEKKLSKIMILDKLKKKNSRNSKFEKVGSFEYKNKRNSENSEDMELCFGKKASDSQGKGEFVLKFEEIGKNDLSKEEEGKEKELLEINECLALNQKRTQLKKLE
jgi:hypothetical protein